MSQSPQSSIQLCSADDKKTWKVWVHSDLQLSVPKVARSVLRSAVDDLLCLDLELDGVWCLGDALCGSDLPMLEAVAHINVEEMERLKVPVTYLAGNHEMDLKRVYNLDRYPLYELASRHSQWRIAMGESLYFEEFFGETLVIFTGDHFARDGRWWTTHGMVKGDVASYPYPPEEYRVLRRRMETHPGPVVIASHYALPGGQRPSSLLEDLLPLPANVRLHLHGHAHIGDLVHNKEFPWRRKNPICEEGIHQFNISALETVRSPGSHSALLEIGQEGPVSLSIRCHMQRRWVERFEFLPSAHECIH